MLTLLATGIFAGEDEPTPAPTPTPSPTPTPAPTGLLEQFHARYGSFASVADATVQIWLDEAQTETATWSDATRTRGVMLYAAHRLAEQGLGKGAIPAGVTSFKSGTFSASMSDSIAGRTGFEATVYGREYLALARRQFAGPRLAWEPPAHIGSPGAFDV